MACLAKFLVVVLLTCSLMALFTNGQDTTPVCSTSIPVKTPTVLPACTTGNLTDVEGYNSETVTGAKNCCKWGKPGQSVECCGVYDGSTDPTCDSTFSTVYCTCRPISAKGDCTNKFLYGSASATPSNAKAAGKCCQTANHSVRVCCKNAVCPAGYTTKACASSAIG